MSSEKEELQKIVDQRIKEKKKEIKKEAKKEARQEIKQEILENIRKETGNEDMSRRQFLKKAGLGAVGLGALSLSPAAGSLKLTKNGIFSSSGSSDFNSLKTDSLTVGGFQGTPIWKEESESPYSATNSSSITVSNLDQFDLYKVFYKATDKASSSNNPKIQLSGDTGSNYNQRLSDGTREQGLNSLGPLTGAASDGYTTGKLVLTPYGNYISLKNISVNPEPGSLIQGGENTNISWPPSQVTLKRGAETDWDVRVWGRNL